ncbi:hypothetical protein LSAT2_013508, partial [Lamellibrachia satsuma]
MRKEGGISWKRERGRAGWGTRTIWKSHILQASSSVWETGSLLNGFNNYFDETMHATCVLLLLCHLLVTCQGRRDASDVEHRRFSPVEQDRAVKAPPPDLSIHRLAAVNPEIIAKAPRVPVVSRAHFDSSDRDVPETRVTGPETGPRAGMHGSRAVGDVPETRMKAAAPRTDLRATMHGSSSVEGKAKTILEQ